jgi:hypothetical protein
MISAIIHAIRTGSTTYSVSELGIPGLRHFVYKSRAQVQVTVPVWEDPYDEVGERRRCVTGRHLFETEDDDSSNDRSRLTTLYQILHDAIHGKSGQGETLKLQYIRTDREAVLGWVRMVFLCRWEMY